MDRSARAPFTPQLLPAIERIGVAVAVLLLCAASILRVARPPAAVPATAPDTVFSAERAMRHVEQIASGRIRWARRTTIAFAIISSGSSPRSDSMPQIQQATAIGTRYQEAGRVQNILAWLPGSRPERKGCADRRALRRRRRGPAASDDGAGSAALLETIRALRARKQPLAHDVIVLFTDGEEAGLLGAAAFVREHPWAKDVAFMLNFEARGTSGRSFMFETGPGNLDAASALRRAGNVDGGIGFHHDLSRSAQRHRPLGARGARSPRAQLRVCRRRRTLPYESR